ncbi:hypothetical protein ABT324_07250 [Saccharopolyspora sp. NPDC000359]|uniref:hypothetical protein n=1 Tax=Saccharopolyspora sp. NPDC000359 TaxID=3154251 RepID=UPI003331A22F
MIAVVAGLVIGLGGGFGLLPLLSSEPAAHDDAGKPAQPRTNLLAGSFERAPAVNFGGQPLPDACALVQPADLERLGIPIAYPVDIKHTYLDPQVTDPQVHSRSRQAPAECLILIQGREDGILPSVRVEFHAVPFSHENDVRVFDYGYEHRTKGDLVLYVDRPEPGSSYDFRAKVPLGDGKLIGVTLSDPLESYRGVPTSQLFDQIVDTVLDNYARGATGVQGFRYQEPYGTPPSACAVFSPAAFELVTGKQDSGWVEERIPSYERQILNSRVGGYIYLEYTCRRVDRAALDESGPTTGKELTVTYYRNEREAAAHDELCKASTDIGVLGLDTAVGDGQSCISTVLDSSTLLFRSGRAGFSLPANEGEDPRTFRDRAVPITQQILRDLNG